MKLALEDDLKILDSPFTAHLTPLTYLLNRYLAVVRKSISNFYSIYFHFANRLQFLYHVESKLRQHIKSIQFQIIISFLLTFNKRFSYEITYTLCKHFASQYNVNVSMKQNKIINSKIKRLNIGYQFFHIAFLNIRFSFPDSIYIIDRLEEIQFLI